MIGKEFILAGKAIFTVSNNKGEWYTFRVKHKEAEGRFQEAWFVSLLTGPDNTASYTYLGMLSPQALDASQRVRLTAKSKYSESSKPVQVLRWALHLVWTGGTFPEGYAIKHEGRCGRCGRLLTVPESIDRGIGPECYGKMEGKDDIALYSSPLAMASA